MNDKTKLYSYVYPRLRLVEHGDSWWGIEVNGTKVRLDAMDMNSIQDALAQTYSEYQEKEEEE